MATRKNKGKASPRHPGKPQACALPAGVDGYGAGGAARFHLEEKLGAGGMCEVHAALDLRRVECGDASPRVAVKRLLPKLGSHPRARLVLAQEFCILRQLTHPGVVRVFDLHREPFGLCFSMELLEGTTARATLGRQADGMGRAAIPWATKLFSVLAFLHDQGVAHGDVKPGNIFLAPEGRLVLMDFNVAEVTARPGAACAAVAKGLRESLCLPSHSLLYAGPERLQGGAPSPADDIHAACCTVYEMASGVHPFGRLSALEAMGGNIFPQKPFCLGNRHWAMLRRGLSFDPALRPGPAELAACFAGQYLPVAWTTTAKKIFPFHF